MQVKKESAWRKPAVWGSLLMILMVLTAYRLRMPEIEKISGAQNMEATYHVLLTATALDESPLASHWLLPTVSLGRAADKNIPWGATIPTRSGDYVYTSFTPAGFVAPYLWFKALGQAPSATNLAIFNVLLGALTACGLFLLLLSLLQFRGHAPRVAVAAALLGSAIGIFSREALLSHGVIYWSHCLYQPILVLSLYLLFQYLRDETRRVLYARALMAAAFLGPMTEWTGYVFNAGVVLLLCLYGALVPLPPAGMRALARKIVVISAAAGVVTVAYYSLAAGVDPAVDAFLQRFLARSAASGTFADLITGYGLSYGVFLLPLLPILALRLRPRAAVADIDADVRRKITTVVFLAACFPLLENVVMLQHATQFSFDRLKFIFPAGIILAFAFARCGVKGRMALFAVIGLACASSFHSYRQDLKSYAAWSEADAGNRELATRILTRVDGACAMFSSNIAVRGYSSLLFHRGIYEGKTRDESMALMTGSGACALVYLEGVWAFPDLPRYARATLMRPNGSSEVLRVMQ
jgi:hypothetical protein